MGEAGCFFFTDPRMLSKGEQCLRDHFASRVYHGHEPSCLHPVCCSEVGETPAHVWSIPRSFPARWHSGRCSPHQISQPAGPSFPSKAPLPQELSEAEGHNPLLTRRNELLVKSQAELWILGLKEKKKSPLPVHNLGEHANHHSMHTVCLEQHKGSGLQCCNTTELALGRAQLQVVLQLFKQTKRGGNKHVVLPDSPQNAALVAQ